MELNVIALAIPVFFTMIGIEVLVARRQRRDLFTFETAVADLSCGIGNQVSAILFGGLLFAVYVWVHENWKLFDLSSSSTAVWVAGFLLTDVVYYFWHRASHRVNFIWAAHVVHHHSQDYNLAVALRQAWFTQFSNNFFFFSLALLGVPPVVFAVSISVNTLYQFWIHTQTINTMGPLEWVLNTPSHHRVHHGINPQYIDKNYAGVFIIWDRLFGTFTREQEPVVYGTVTPFVSANPVWANFVMWRELAVRASGMRSLVDKILVYVGPPEWTPGGLKPTPPVSVDTYEKFKFESVNGGTGYVVFQFLVVTAFLVAVLLFQGRLPVVTHVLFGGLIIWTTLNFSGIFERRKWFASSERLRLVVTPLVIGGGLVLAGISETPLASLLGAAIGVSALGFVLSAKVVRAIDATA